MASFHFSILEAEKEGNKEVFQIGSMVDDKRLGLIFEKVVRVHYVGGHIFIPKQNEQLKGLPLNLIAFYKSSLKNFLHKERLNYFN
jgi:hypothetical protein